jgi:hypothetical protein
MVSLVVSGFFATSILSLKVWQRIDTVPQLVDSRPGTNGRIMFLVILTAGLITDDMGARLERRSAAWSNLGGNKAVPVALVL